jgi:hypothetical protein
MPAFLVTGNPGSGKSTLARELARRGFVAVDPDDDPELAHWQDGAGNQADGPQRPDDAWLRSHRWVWSRPRMEEVLAGQEGAVFVCGIARNQDELLISSSACSCSRSTRRRRRPGSPATMRAIHPAAAKQAGKRSAMAEPHSTRKCSGSAPSPSTARHRQSRPQTNFSLSSQAPEAHASQQRQHQPDHAKSSITDDLSACEDVSAWAPNYQYRAPMTRDNGRSFPRAAPPDWQQG